MPQLFFGENKEINSVKIKYKIIRSVFYSCA